MSSSPTTLRDHSFHRLVSEPDTLEFLVARSLHRVLVAADKVATSPYNCAGHGLDSSVGDSLAV